MYFWDEVARRYRDERGRFVARSVVWDYVQQSINGAHNVSNILADLVGNGQLAPKDWYSLMKEEIKREYIRQYLLGHGGLDTMTPADWGRIGQMLREQYQYLKRFAGEIATGALSPAQIAARSAMYFNSAREAYETANAINALAWGAVEERWLVSPIVENCPDCLAFQDEGWKPFGYFPMPGRGATVCLCIISPEGKILTQNGWKPMFDVQVGELVWTHKNRWRKVTALVIKPSLPEHRLAKVGGVYCTDNHLFYTESGWHNSTHIRNSDISCYTIAGVEQYEKNLQEMRYEFTSLDNVRLMREMCQGMSLREYERSKIIRMSALLGKEIIQSGNKPMGAHGGQNEKELERSGGTTQNDVSGIRKSYLADTSKRRALLELVLEERQKENRLSLSMGLGNGTWRNPRWLCYPSCERGSYGRQVRKPAIDDQKGAHGITRTTAYITRGLDVIKGENNSRTGFAELDVQAVRKELSEIFERGERTSFLFGSMQGELSTQEYSYPYVRDLWNGVSTPIGSWEKTEVLLGGVLPQQTVVFDIEVEEDHSFCIEGLFAHNTNCHCLKEYRNAAGEIYYGG